MRLILIGLLVLMTAPVMAQVEGYSTTTSAQAQAAQEPAWVATDILERKDGGFTLRNGRTYMLDKNTVIENIRIGGVTDIDNVFDFDNGVMFVKTGSASRSAETFSFSELAAGRADRLKEYGCYMARNSRTSEAAFFIAKHCQ